MKKVRTALIVVLALLPPMAVDIPTNPLAFLDVAMLEDRASNSCKGSTAFSSESPDVDSGSRAVAGDRGSVVTRASMPIEEARHAASNDLHSVVWGAGVKVCVAAGNQPAVGLRLRDGMWNSPTPVAFRESATDLGGYERGEK